jgi:ATP-dependent RNA helicase DeaD
LKDLALYYKDKHDLVEQKLAAETMTTQEETVDVTETETEGDRDRERRDRDRGGKPRRKDENMVRFFFNLGKKTI